MNKTLITKHFTRKRKQKAPEIKDFRSFLVRREGFEPPAFWSVAATQKFF